MTFPIITGELRLAVRRKRIFITRMIVAALGTLLVLFLDRNITGTDSTKLFIQLSAIMAFWAVISGCWGYDTLSLEKREGTLGLLFLTHVRAEQIAFEKLISNAIPGFYGLLSGMISPQIPLK